MRYSIIGFSQEQIIKTDLDITDLFILDYIQRACGSPSMAHTVTEDGKPTVWISHTKFIEDLPILRISKKTFENRISNLKKDGYLLSISVANEKGRGSKTYYGITEKTEALSYKYEDTTTSQNWEMVTTTTSREKEMVSTTTSQNREVNIVIDNNKDIYIDNKLDIDNKLQEKEKENIKEKEKPKAKPRQNKLSLSEEIEMVNDSDLSDRAKSSLIEWFTYKEDAHREYYVQRSITKIIEEIKGYCSQYGDGYVINSINFTIARGYKGIVWSNQKQNGTPSYGALSPGQIMAQRLAERNRARNDA